MGLFLLAFRQYLKKTLLVLVLPAPRLTSNAENDILTRSNRRLDVMQHVDTKLIGGGNRLIKLLAYPTTTLLIFLLCVFFAALSSLNAEPVVGKCVGFANGNFCSASHGEHWLSCSGKTPNLASLCNSLSAFGR